MRITVLLIVITFTIFSCSTHDDTQTKKEELKTTVAAYYDALAKKDIQRMTDLTATDFVFFDDGVPYTNKSAVKFVEGLPAFTATFKFDSINARIDKSNASAYYFREATFTIQGNTYTPIKFLESATFIKENGKWKIRFLHSSLRK
jgi:ketosteroid isomerase-like protein